MTRTLLATLLIVVIAAPFTYAIGRDTALFTGGTADLQPGLEGVLGADQDRLSFTTGRGPVLEISYSGLVRYVYRKSSRRTPLALFFRTRSKHFLSIQYRDATDEGQAVVFEVGKDLICPVLRTVQRESGNIPEYADRESERACQ